MDGKISLAQAGPSLESEAGIGAVGAPQPPSAASVGTNHRNLTRGLSATALGAAINLPISLLTLPLFLHRLSLVAFGVYASLGSLLSIIGLIEAGVGTEIVRRVAAAHGAGDRAGLRTSVHKGTSILLGMGLAVSALGALVGFGFPSLIFGALSEPLRSQVPLITFVVSCTVGLDLFLSGWFATLTGLQRSDWASISGLAGTLIGTALSVCLVFAGDGIWSLAWGSVAQVAVSAVIRTAGMRRLAPEVDLRLTRVGAAEVRSYAGTSAVVLVATVANIIDFQFDKILLANIVGAAAAGLYQVGAALALQARAVAMLPVGILLPSTAELGEGDRLKRVRLAVTSLNTAASIALMGGIVIFAPLFVRLWLGAGYGRSAYAAQILAVALFFNAMTGPWYSYCIGSGEIRIPFLSAVANAVVNGVASWSLIAVIGFDGALYGSLAGNAAGLLCFAYQLYRTQGGDWFTGLAKPIVLGAALVGLGQLVVSELPKNLLVLVCGGTGWVILLGALFLKFHWLPFDLRRGRRLGIHLEMNS